MKLLLVRHGPAGGREAWAGAGKDDEARPLTKKGRAKMRKAAAGLAALVPEIGLIATSPLTRARETARILAERWPRARFLLADALRPDAPQKDALRWLASLRAEDCVVLVGHEPALGLLACRLLSDSPGSFLELKKGACALLECPAPARPGEAVLRRLLQPKQLRGLA